MPNVEQLMWARVNLSKGRMATVKPVAGAFPGGFLARFATVANQASANNLNQVPTSGTRCQSLFFGLIDRGIFNLPSMPSSARFYFSY